MSEPYALLDLFSGIGGFSLGLERTGIFKTTAFCEIEEFPRKVLARHWPETPIYDDIRHLTADRLARDGVRVNAICGGFPCQDISAAGRRAGIDGERSGLWADYARLIRELRPAVVIVENSPGLLGGGIGRVLGVLAAIGYDAEWSPVPACAVGFPHMRRRLWIVAYPQGEWGQQRWRLQFAQGSDRPRDVHQRFCEPAPARVADGVSRRMDRNKGLGNAVVPQIPEMIGRAIAPLAALAKRELAQ